jgi:hypothetical protein
MSIASVKALLGERLRPYPAVFGLVRRARQFPSRCRRLTQRKRPDIESHIIEDDNRVHFISFACRTL